MKTCVKFVTMICLIGFVFFLSSISLISAEIQTLGSSKQNECVGLKQICSNCTYVNITSITYPNLTQALGEVNMTKIGTEYNYTFCNTNLIGKYIINGKGDDNGITKVWTFDHYVTSSGDKVSLSNTIIVIIFIVIALMFFFIGYSFEKDKFIVKTSFYIFAMLSILLGLNSARIIASESAGLFNMSTTGIILVISTILFMFLYVFILWTIDTFKKLKEKKSLRWKY